MKLDISKWRLPLFTVGSLFGGHTRAGLVIRSSDVELLAVRGRAVASQVRVPLEQPDESALTQAIQKALAAAALKSMRIAVAVPSQEVLIRFFTIPVLPKAEWESVVQFEARKYMPFKTEALAWDYRVLASSSEKLDVVFAAMQQEAFRRIQHAVTQAGLEPVLMEPQSLSLARVVAEESRAPSNEFICVVDVEATVAHLAVVKHHVPYLTRDISFVAGASARAGEGPPASADVEDRRVERLLSELSVSMDFFMREYPSTRVSQVWLFGDEALIGPWCRWLSERLPCPVALGHPLLARCIQGEVPLPFASAVGLVQALGGSEGASIDFLKRSQAPAPASAPRPVAVAQSLPADPAEAVVASLKDPRALALGGLLAAALLVFFSLLGREHAAKVRRRLDQLVHTRAEVGWGLAKMDQADLQALQKNAQTYLTVLQRAVEQRVSVAAKLDALARVLPDGMWLTGLSFEDRLDPTGKSQPQFKLSGACFLGDTAKELSAIQQFQELVKANPHFFDGLSAAQLDHVDVVKPSTSQQATYTYRTFQLNCRGGG